LVLCLVEVVVNVHELALCAVGIHGGRRWFFEVELV
jgi:hypothetical protein